MKDGKHNNRLPHFETGPQPPRRWWSRPAGNESSVPAGAGGAAAVSQRTGPRRNAGRALRTAVLGLLLALPGWAHGQETAEIDRVQVNGEAGPDGGQLVISATLKKPDAAKAKLLFATRLDHVLQVGREQVRHTFHLETDILQGRAKELAFPLHGKGIVKAVEAKGLKDWSVRRDPDGGWTLVLRLAAGEQPVEQFSAVVRAVTDYPDVSLPHEVSPLCLGVDAPSLFNGHVRIESSPGVEVTLRDRSGLTPLELEFAPDALRQPAAPGAEAPKVFQFHAVNYNVGLTVAEADPEARMVVLRDFRLTGDLTDRRAGFVLAATAHVKNPQGGRLALLGGGYALTEIDTDERWEATLAGDQLVLTFDQPGVYPLRIGFDAAVQENGDWRRLDFRVAPAALQPVTLRGLAADTEFRFPGAAKPEREAEVFRSFLPPDGHVALSWMPAQPETEGRLFYAAEGFEQIAISPGLLRQTTLLQFKVMQGELSELTLLLDGAGEVTRVQGAPVLAWQLSEPDAGANGRRRLRIQFNQPQKDQFGLQVETQTTLGAFPLPVTPVRLAPEGATRYGGYVRVSNTGAVRLEVLESRGLSQISPEQLPQSAETRHLLPANTSQTFAFRFSGDDFSLRVQADNILPELSVSEVLAYHLGDTDLAIEAELELDIREAPVRELTLRVPAKFVVARLTAPDLADHTLLPGTEPDTANLRLTFAKPVGGRQLVQLRIERNAALEAASWDLPRIEVLKARSTRGHVGVSAAAGFRLTPERTKGLTDIATAFFPKKAPNLQAAFRVSDPAWQATLKVERLPQSIQVDAFHLFSVGEAIAYGSSVMNYVISGAPLSRFRVELSAEYFNVEFTGKDILNWKQADGGYEIQLSTPVAGEYTLLATYERPFKPQGETLTFTGARPLDAGAEQGHTIVISTYQFQVQPEQVSPGLQKVEPGEVPASYRLFFDAPILAAYRYTSRPFNLALALQPLNQAETLQQVVDRAALDTRISEEGQILTTVRYFVKNKGRSNLRIAVPPDSELWEASVDGRSVVPVKDDQANLIALPQTTDPNAVHRIELQLAAKSKHPRRITLTAPSVAAPVLLTEWNLAPDVNRRLSFRGGTLTPSRAGSDDISGFAAVGRFLGGENGLFLLTALALFFVSALIWRWAGSEATHRFSARHVLGTLIGLIGATCGMLVLADLFFEAGRIHLAFPTTLHFLAPVQQAGSTLRVELSNDPLEPSVLWLAWRWWPAVLGIAACLGALVVGPAFLRRCGVAVAWTGLLWSALRWPNGLPLALGILMLFLTLHVLLPSIIRLCQTPKKPAPPAPPTPPAETPAKEDGETPPPSPPAGAGAAAAAAVGLLLAGWLSFPPLSGRAAQQAAQSGAAPDRETSLAESVVQTATVKDDYVTVTAKVRWRAEEGDLLPLLYPPGVLMDIQLPEGVRLLQAPTRQGRLQELIAGHDGVFEVSFTYQLTVQEEKGRKGFHVPTQFGLVNRLALTLSGLDVDVVSPQAVSITPGESPADQETRADLVLAPQPNVWIGWKPRSRDTRKEKAVFHAECFQLFVPTAGIVEGAHVVKVRPAQGELSEMTFTVPTGLTITDVLSPALSFWRFDPDERLLRVTLSSAQAKPFALTIGSQIATRPLPYEQTTGLIAVNGAATQVGMTGVATGAEVQLDQVTAGTLATINLDDFPAEVLASLGNRVPGLTLRRAFRYAKTDATLTLKASPVEPDVRVISRQTLSLGEDRSLLGAGLDVTVTRAGIFKLSFALPPALEVESLSGGALSHWTELKTDTNRVITLHLKGRTEGRQHFDLALAGPGLRTTNGWSVPRLALREANKQQGQLVIVPEQGMRLQAAERDGVIPLDPKTAGARQKSALAFRLLSANWQLRLDVERVDAWVQVNSFQQVSVQEGQARVTANLDYQIENSGLRALRVRLPEAAENVRFTGPQIADFLPVSGSVTNATQGWEIKLDRRVIGGHRLSASYTLRVPADATEIRLRGVVAEGVNVQRGFLATQAAGRLQLQLDQVPDSLLPADWEAVPAGLRRNLATTSASHVFRLVSPGFELPVRILRHQAAAVLPARVQSVELTSVISDAGEMLTRGRVALTPGDKRLLRLRLPKEAEFWFAFVNEGGVWLWHEGEDVLIPLQQAATSDGPTTVDFYYTTRSGRASTRRLDLDLHGPKLDLPLQQITWNVLLDPKWEVTDWHGTLQLQDTTVVARVEKLDLGRYLENERSLQLRQTAVAKQNFARGNTAILAGDVQSARRYLNNAYQLSQADQAFNEDARVQLKNLKTEQALIGLNVNRVLGQQQAAPQAQAEQIQQIVANDANYTREQAKQISESLPAEDQLALSRLAEKIVEQQDAAVANPTAIRATIPEQGRRLTFTRSLQVDTMSDLTISLEARAARTSSWAGRLCLLAAAFVVTVVFTLLPRRRKSPAAEA